MKNLYRRNVFMILVVISCGYIASARRPPFRHAVQTRWNQPPDRKLDYFAFDMFTKINNNLQEEENMVFSPISIFSALSVLGQGANGATRRQLKHVLHTPNFVEMQSFIKETMRKSSDYTLSMARRCYIDTSTLLKKSYKDFLNGTGLHSVKKLDFQNHPDESRRKINSWVSHHTLGQIDELLKSDQVTSFTKIYLVNALALEAPWKRPFTGKTTEAFHISPTKLIDDMEFMRTSSTDCLYYEPEFHSIVYRRNKRGRLAVFNQLDATVLALPFKGEKLAFIVAMPHQAGDFSQLVSRKGQKYLDQLLKLWSREIPGHGNFNSYALCDVTMPKFEFKYDYKRLREGLEEMGATDMFDAERADFSQLYRGEPGLYVSDVAHIATFAVDEKGVKASAATALGLSYRMLHPSVVIERPFMFWVRNIETGAVLFMGKVVNPNTPF